MDNKSKLARSTAASAKCARYLASSLFAHVERFYEARMEKAQMRLAPTSRARVPRRSTEFHRR